MRCGPCCGELGDESIAAWNTAHRTGKLITGRRWLMASEPDGLPCLRSVLPRAASFHHRLKRGYGLAV
jgi:hypothetical protein